MPRRSRPSINRTKIDSSSSIINPTKIDPEARVSFNFRRLIEKEKKFVYCSKEVKYFLSLVERLKDISNFTKKQLVNDHSKSLRFHPIDFKDKSVSENTFDILSEDVDDDAWQFSLSSNEYGRVHGYFVDDVFYIVWLDPDHKLC